MTGRPYRTFRRPAAILLGIAALAVIGLPEPAAAAFSGGDPVCNRIRREARRTLCHCRTSMGGIAQPVGRGVRIRGAASHRLVPLIWACTTGWKPGLPPPRL